MLFNMAGVSTLLQAHGFTTLFVLFKWDLQAAMKDYPEDQALLSRLNARPPHHPIKKKKVGGELKTPFGNLVC